MSKIKVSSTFVPSGIQKANLFRVLSQLLMVAGCPLHSLACGLTTLFSVSIIRWHSSYVQISFFLYGHQSLDSSLL